MILNFIKNIVFGFNWELKKITPEYLVQKKSLLSEKKYISWLRVQVTICQSEISMIEDKKKTVPQGLLDKYKIIETERFNEESKYNKQAG